MKYFGFLLGFLMNVSFAPSALASAWIGCDACRNVSMEGSPMCSYCAVQQFPSVPTWGMPQTPYCPTCNMPNLYETPSMAPWWMSSAPNYWNFYMPGPYNGIGMMPQYFPNLPYTPNQGGGMYMAKPVVYVRGPKGSKIDITLKDGKSELLVAVPSQKNWKAQLDGRHLKTSEGKYEYFFYDAWVDHNVLQDKNGACGDRKEMLDYMKNALLQRKFPAEAVQDFEQTWRVKLPHQQQLCVYPQTEQNLAAGVKLEFKPATVKLTQLEFVVVPKKFFKSPLAKKWNRFTQAPVGEAVFRALASVNDQSRAILAYDWGVGFIRAEE